MIQPKSAEEQRKVLQYVWNNLPAGFLIKLQDSVPERIDAVLKVKGGHNTRIQFSFYLHTTIYQTFFGNLEMFLFFVFKASSLYGTLKKIFFFFFYTCRRLLHSTVYLEVQTN